MGVRGAGAMMRDALALTLLLAGCNGAPNAPAGQRDTTSTVTAANAPLAVRYDQHIFAGGMAPAGDTMHNPLADNPKMADEGAKLFSAMNCDGCHGAADGWVAPSLKDNRWRYGGSDGAIYQTIFYGRPKGMPAFGGILGRDAIWRVVSYIRSLPPPKAVPTQAW